MLNVEKIRADFPILQQDVYPDTPLVFLDSAASSQRPRQVIEAMDGYYARTHANVHRGIYRLSGDDTRAQARALREIGPQLDALGIGTALQHPTGRTAPTSTPASMPPSPAGSRAPATRAR